LYFGRSDFAVNGVSCKVNEDVVRVLKDFHKAKKPIGLCCIAPVLAAKVFNNVTITLGKKGNKCNVMPSSTNLRRIWLEVYLAILYKLWWLYNIE
jgi:enhancing lycopene biosynthesis protein 2